MDSEKRARRQSFRLIISEIIMVIAVITMVIVLAFLVSGYWLGSGFKVERQGMLQISSVPTGATVAVDGEAPWYQRTNTSKVLSSGEHVVRLSKDGYDSWSRTVNIREGLLYRVNYPRLFLLNRDKEPVLKSTATTFATVSPDQNWLLLINNTTAWQLINLTSDKIEPKALDVSSIFSSVSLATGATTGLFTGTIKNATWDSNNEHVLIQSEYSGTTEWVLLNVKNPTQSINLTREFATSFSSIRLFDNSASTLLAIKSGNLHKIDVSTHQISAVLIENVKYYDFYGQEIIFTSLNEDEEYSTDIVKLNNLEDITHIISTPSPSKAFISRFYDEKYITIITDNTITVQKYDNQETFFEDELEFIPNKIKIGYGGGFVFMNDGVNVITFDMEAVSLRSWNMDSEHYGWLDGHTIYTVREGELIVYDFDGLNRRIITTPVSANFPVTITDNKWLYYFSDGYLTREKILD